MPQRIVALEITESELKAAVVETSFRDYRVVGFYRQVLSSANGPVEAQIRRFVEQNALAGETVLSVLPGHHATWRRFSLPFRDRKKLGQTIPFELENLVPFGLDDVVVDYQVLQRDRTGTTVLAALVPKKEIEGHLALLSAAGLDPKVVDLAPLAAQNVLNLVPDLPPDFAVLDFASDHVTVAVYREKQLVGLRTIVPSPPAADASATPRAGGEVEAVVAEIRWTLLALLGAPPGADFPCYLAGERDDLNAVQAVLAESLGTSLRRFDRIALRNLPGDARAQVPGFLTSLGLALREVAPNGALGLNFRRGEFAFHRAEQELRRGLRGVAALAAVVVALTVADLYVEYRQQVQRVAAFDGQIRRVAEETLTGEKVVNPVEQLQAEIDALKQRVDVINSIIPLANSTSLDVLRTISEAVPKSIRVNAEEYLMDADAVRVKGNTDSFEAVDSIKRQMQSTGLFSEVKVNEAKAAKEGVDFRLTLTFAKGFRGPEAQP